jgi:hypothetical protein
MLNFIQDISGQSPCKLITEQAHHALVNFYGQTQHTKLRKTPHVMWFCIVLSCVWTTSNIGQFLPFMEGCGPVLRASISSEPGMGLPGTA